MGFGMKFSKQRNPNVLGIALNQDYPRALRGSGGAALQSYPGPLLEAPVNFFLSPV